MQDDSHDTLGLNLDALSFAQPALAKILANVAPYELEEARDGTPTLKLKSIWVHSRYNPINEVNALVSQIISENYERIVLAGFGLGYAAAKIYQQHDSRLIFVIEPDTRLVRTALEISDLSAAIKSGKLEIYCPNQQGELRQRASTFEHSDFVRSFQFLEHQYTKSLAETYQPLLEEFSDTIRVRSMQITSGMSGTRQTLTNVLGNVGSYASATPSINFSGKFHGKPGILVGAGPSLARNMEALKAAQGKAIIGVVSTALKPCLAAGIKPTFTAVVDYHADSVRYFDDISPEDAPPLFADPRTNSKVFEAWQGNVVMNSEAYLETLFHDSGLPEYGSLPDGNTVAHHAFFHLQNLGCDPIILVGMDLGYPEYVTHVPGTAIYDEWQPNTGPFSTFEMQEMHFVMRYRQQGRKWKDIHGHNIWSDKMMEAYALEFKRFFKKAPQTIVHAVEGGVDLGCDEVCSLSEAIRRWCKDDVNLSMFNNLESIDIRQTRHNAALEGIDKRLTELDAFAEAQKSSLRMLRKADKRLNKGITELTDLRQELTVLDERTRHLAYLREALLRFAAADAIIRLRSELADEAKGGEMLTRYRRLVERETAYLRGMAKAREELRSRLMKAKVTLQAKTPELI
ncbi:MAG: 6-hydroxymethylpterin diphosphokinase MptE-like protein [Planctomycetota bacterium]